jgi:hypothetical protein
MYNFKSEKAKRKVVAVEGNILEYNLFPSNSIDVLVSTNTLIRNHIKSKKYRSIIESFCDYVGENGHIYFNMSGVDFTNEIHKHLLSEFEEVEVIPYNNEISDRWEAYLESKKGRPSIADNILLRYGQYSISLILSKVELIRSENTRKSYIRCKKKL